MVNLIPVVVAAWVVAIIVTVQRFPRYCHIIIPVMTAAMVANITIFIVQNK